MTEEKLSELEELAKEACALKRKTHNSQRVGNLHLRIEIEDGWIDGGYLNMHFSFNKQAMFWVGVWKQGHVVCCEQKEPHKFRETIRLALQKGNIKCEF